jgi:SMC interacting uncharacterized protein involved in chromosome segregation
LKSNFRIIERWAKLIRDLGLIIGVPILIAIGVNLHDQQTAALKAQNEALAAQNALLKETSYDRALDIIEAQKKLSERERTNYESEIQTLQQSGDSKEQQIAKLQSQLSEVNEKIQVLGASKSNIVQQIQQLAPPSNFRIRIN